MKVWIMYLIRNHKANTETIRLFESYDTALIERDKSNKKLKNYSIKDIGFNRKERYAITEKQYKIE